MPVMSVILTLEMSAYALAAARARVSSVIAVRAGRQPGRGPRDRRRRRGKLMGLRLDAAASPKLRLISLISRTISEQMTDCSVQAHHGEIAVASVDERRLARIRDQDG